MSRMNLILTPQRGATTDAFHLSRVVCTDTLTPTTVCTYPLEPKNIDIDFK